MKSKRSWDREYGTANVLVLPVLLFALSGLAAPQVVPPANGRDQDDLRFSVELDLVVLQATVRDRKEHGKLSVRTRTGYIAGGELQPGKGAK